MRGLVERCKNRIKRDEDLALFKKYSFLSKCNTQRYNSKSVILFRLDLIGDCTMFTGAAKAIRELYQDRKMTIVCLSVSRQIFERMGIFDRIISVDFKPERIDYKKLQDVIAELRKDTYDILLQPQISKFPLADILAAAVKCNKRIAIQPMAGNSSPQWLEQTNGLYDVFIPYPEDAVSEFDYYGAFVRGLGNPDYKTTRPRLPYSEQHFIEGNYYVLYPGGSLPYKLWPAERFAQLANYIYRQTGLTGVILGAPSEQEISHQLKLNLNLVTSLATVDLTGRTSIGDVIDIIGNAKFVVSNDTSGVHIACATNTPSVAIVGGWHFKRFLPYHIEDVKEGDHLPLIAYVEMPCYYCGWDWSLIGQRREACLHRMEKGNTCECIDKITFEHMRVVVDELIKEAHL